MNPDQALHALYVQSTRKASPADIKDHLRALEESRTFPAVFVREAMAGKAVTTDAWAEVLKALSRTTRQYSIGDKAFMATLKELQQPWLLQAIQAATVSDDAPLVVLAALAHDGTETSHDALLAEFGRARAAKSDWALRYKLKRITRYAKPNAHLAALEATVKAELEARDGVKAEHSLAKKLGLNVDLLKFYLEVHGTRPRQTREVFLIISADDRGTGLPTQALGVDDKPPRDFLKVRDWLATVTRKEKVAWNWDAVRLRTNLRGKHRDAMVAWLRGQRETPLP
ncbi:MAG: hypothetical protein U0228_08850 [Myxococcaceae bacterium]